MVTASAHKCFIGVTGIAERRRHSKLKTRHLPQKAKKKVVNLVPKEMTCQIRNL